MEEKRVIRVTGKGTLKIKPDLTRITITLKGCHKEYEKTLENSSDDAETLKRILETQGFETSDVKTISFDVNSKYEGYQAKDGNWKQRFLGYEFTHVLKVEFDSDNDRLGKILYALANAEKIKPEFHLSFTVKDKEAAKNELLGKAVEDARAKALVLSKAAGVKLQNVKSIDYSWGEMNFDVSPMRENLLMKSAADGAAPRAAGSYAMNLEPDDVAVTDTVTVVWGID